MANSGSRSGHGGRRQVWTLLCGIYQKDYTGRKKGSLPILPDPPLGDVDVNVGVVRAEETRFQRSIQSVVGIVDDEKMLTGFELMWVAGSMVLLLFLNMNLRGSEVEHRDVETGSEMGDKSHKASVASHGPHLSGHAELDRVTVGHARSMDDVVWCVGAPTGSGQLGGDLRGVRSASDVVAAFVGDRTRECVAAV
ncbi:hypothetical protein V6N12_013253 [Hibiscus sabdariffa]|uniref:Uncharacterized protein n=1 Tax=Hibiscus sabdariffa TaxID=183260 RepID=A0ABR2D5Z5_9ROSI